MVDVNYKTANFSLRDFWNEKEDGMIPEDIYHNVVSVMGYLQKVREKFGKPMNVSCGWREAKHNARVRGSATSAHIHGLAADVSCSDKSLNDELGECITKMAIAGEIPYDQIIFENYTAPDNFQWIHYSPKKDATTPPRKMIMVAIGPQPFKNEVITPAMGKKFGIDL